MDTPTLKIIREIISGSSKEELIWLNGYIAGILSGQPAQATGKPAVSRITIAYGTESGNSKKLATDFATQARKQGINAKLVSLDQYRLTDLSKEEYFFTIISTQGEGEPPAAAKKFYDHIHQNGFRLDKMKFGVLALGDTAYPLFCKAGEDVDAQLQKLGGERIVNLQKCDTDYEADAGTWFGGILQTLAGGTSAVHTPGIAAAPKKAGHKKNLTGTVLTNVNLNDRGSKKQTHHLEISAEELDYQPGDSIGIVPENTPALVDSILHLAGCTADKTVSYKNEKWALGELLRKKLNILHLPGRVIQKYATLVQQEIPETRMGLLELLKIYPVKDESQFNEVLGILEPTAPRLYSISSSPAAHSGEVHITVARDRYSVNGEEKFGLCSDMLCHLPENGNLEFYIHHNARFKLPEPNKDIIMIGPGTGIAPFRAFLAERDASGATGKNWLFFGDQHFRTDFLYQTEFQDWLHTGLLTKLNVAFSRDQEEKVYVQHKMLAHGAAFFEWLESGAYIYICGAKEPMSVDVEQSILQVIEIFGNRSATEARQYLDALNEAGRYLKDVY